MPKNHHVARYQEVEVSTATPVELVVMLYDAAISSLQTAGEAMAAGDIATRTRSVNKVSSILAELQATLDFAAGGEIANSLDRLYAYMRNRLYQANLKQDPAAIEEVARLLAGLRSAWMEVVQSESCKKGGPVFAGSPVGSGAQPLATGAAAPAAPLNLTV